MIKPVIFTTKYFKFAIILCFFSTFLIAQEETNNTTPLENDFWSHVRFGGGIGLGFGNGYTTIALAPSAIYSFNDQFALGPGLNFNYSSSKNEFDATVLGASVIALYKPVSDLIFSAEFEENNVQLNDKIIDSSRNYWYPALYMGGGYAVSDFVSIGIRYDVLFDDTKSIYGSAFTPFVRAYF